MDITRIRPGLRRSAPTRRRRSVAVLAAAGVALGAACTPMPPPPVELPTNPGTFTGTLEPGSFLQTLGPDGVPWEASHVDIGRPACADEKDNDVDGLGDTADPGCTGPQDANERRPGTQEFTPTRSQLNVQANGVVTLRPNDLVIPQREYCLWATDLWCTGITIRGAGPAARGSISGTTMTVPYPITIDLERVAGDWAITPGCSIGYIDAVFTGDDYDEETGRTTLTASDVHVPAATGCGEYEEQINAALGLPTVGESTLVVTYLDEDGDPIQLG